MSGRVLAIGMMIVVLAPAGFVWATENERYARSLERICQNGVTPELVESHRQVTAALDKERTLTEFIGLDAIGRAQKKSVAMGPSTDGAHGRSVNLWGPQSPELAQGGCVQSP